MIAHKSGKTAVASQQGLRTVLVGRSQPQIAKILQLDIGKVNRGLGVRSRKSRLSN